MKFCLNIFFVACTALLFNGCASMTACYSPERRIHAAPMSFNLKYNTVSFKSTDGTRLKGWFVPAIIQPRATIIFLHGRTGNMAEHFPAVAWLPRRGFNVFLFDYRGYGGSRGRPSPEGVYLDSMSAVEYIRSRMDVRKDRLILFGQDMGAANAILAAARDPLKHSNRGAIRAVIAEAPYSSCTDICTGFFGGISALFAGDEDYSPKDYVKKISPTPLLLVHGDSDRTVSPEHSRKLYELADEPRRLWTVKGGGHIDAFTTHGETYRAKLESFIYRALSMSPATHTRKSSSESKSRVAK